jgi:hypothetical protein
MIDIETKMDNLEAKLTDRTLSDDHRRCLAGMYLEAASQLHKTDQKQYIKRIHWYTHNVRYTP